MGLNIRMADFQAGLTPGKKAGGKRDNRTYDIPDLVFIENGSKEIRVRGELKTPWTFFPKKRETQEEFRARKFGKAYFE